MIEPQKKMLRILVVDDDPVFVQLMEAYVTRLGAEFFSAADGQESVDFLREHTVDLCFMDLVMPRMDGIAAVRFIREQLRLTFPIVAVTAFYMRVNIDQCLSAGMQAFVRKPVCFETVADMVHRFCISH